MIMAETLTAPPESCTIPVTGMTCAACSGRVQRSLEQSAGVASANVNLMTGAATVAYDPGVTSPERLVELAAEAVELYCWDRHGSDN